MLERHGAEKEDIDRVLKYLTKEGYIDESRYAAAFVHDKVRFTKWGRTKIAQALWLKRIPEQIVQDALSSIDKDEYMTALKEVTASRYRTMKGATEYERKMKTMKSVCSRGYEPSLVQKVLQITD
jgi:regulatory protein